MVRAVDVGDFGALESHRDDALSSAAPGWNPADYAHHASFVPAMGAAVLALLDARPGEDILDLGCGDGLLTQQIVAAGARVTGLDADTAMLAAARARGLSVVEGNGEALGYAQAFDAVFTNAALHWMLDADAVASGVFAALRRGGRFVGECGGHGNVAAIRTGMRAVLERRGLPWREEQHYASAASWADTLARAGFVDVDAKLIPRPTPLPTGIRGWLQTFRRGVLDPGGDRAPLDAEIEAFLAPMLRDEAGSWTADYVRLRFTAAPSVMTAEDWAATALGHRFARPELLTQALTHSSAGRPDYQRLEFLGDRVLGCAVAAWLFEASEEGEGSLARRLSGLVDRDSCAAVGRALGIEAHVRMDKGAINAGVHRSDNVLADVTEALIGAVFEDAGFLAAQAMVRRLWADRLDARAAAPHDAKSRLQEWAQARGRRLPQYEVIAREGPDHAPRFRIRVGVTGEPPVDAMGASKQEAERNAAQALLDRVAP